jgi:hypothetical protein
LFAACSGTVLPDTGDPVVLDVTISPAKPIVAKGGTEQFKAEVGGTNNPPQTVAWSVRGGGNGTTISGTGLLTVAVGETAAILTVTAVSTFDSAKDAQAYVTTRDGDSPIVPAVIVNPAEANIARGGTQRFNATVSGDNNPGQTVTWTVTGGGDGTSITADGLLTVAADESAAALTVTATSTVYAGTFGTASVTVYADRSQIPAVSSVTVSPAAAAVGKGRTLTFSAAVSGTNNPPQTVTWSVTGGTAAGTVISGMGVLSVAADESARTLTVTAASTVDPGKSGAASVTVSSDAPPPDTTPPAAVSGLAGTPGDRQITLAWTDPADSDLDRIEITWAGGSATAAKSGAGNRANSKTIAGLTNGTTYTFTVKAVDTAGNQSGGLTAAATPADMPPAAVSGLTGTPFIEGVMLAWTDPADADLSHIEITWTGGGSVIAVKSGAGNRANSKTITGLTNGTTYAFTVKAVDTAGNKSAGQVATATPNPTTLQSVAVVSAYLGAVSGGANADGPVPLPVALNLADGTNGWAALLTAIQTADKFVALYLSACTMSGTEFDLYTSNPGARNIVSLVLPDTAAGIAGGTAYESIFRNFTALKSAGGSGITSISKYAFSNCSALTTVNFPAATSIGVSAFLSCSALTTVSFPAATFINDYAFQDCTALTTVSFPKVTQIGGGGSHSFGPFFGCTTLTTVDFPEATSIGDNAFFDCKALTTANFPLAASISKSAFGGTGGNSLTVTLGSAAPTLGSTIFINVTTAKTVTVRVPSGATGYDSVWQDKFKETGNAARSTTLTVVYQ